MSERLVAGHRISVREMGQGPRRALLLHCALARAGAWNGVAARLDDLLSMTAISLPGHGESADWDGQGDYHATCTRIAEAFCDGPTDLIGHSFGATLALRLALERPDLVRSLTLIEPVLFAAARPAAGPGFRAAEAEMQAVLNEAVAGNPEAATRAFTDRWGTGLPWAALTRDQQRYMSDRIGLVLAGQPGIDADTGGMLAPGRLEALDIPVLLVAGALTHPVIAEIHAALAARLPRARCLTIPRAAHMVPITHPGPVADAIRAFLAP